MSKSRTVKKFPRAQLSGVFALYEEVSLKHNDSMAFGGHSNVMSHIFPQLIQTAAVVVIQISMTDLADDVAL